MQENHDTFQVGNWVVNLTEGNYCKIKSLPPNLILKGIRHDYPTTIERIGKIKVTEDKLKVLGFKTLDSRLMKTSSNKIHVALVFSSSGVYKIYKNDEEFCNVQFIHQVQNAYHKITGELLQGNLYGVREG